MSQETVILAKAKHLLLKCVGGWEYAERVAVTGVVAIVAITPDGKVVFTEQFRPPIGRRAIELPAGLAGDVAGQELEALATAAARELLEETGYEAATMTLLGAAPTSAGLTSETVTFFQAGGLKKVAAGGGDASEDIVIHETPLAEIRPWLELMEAEGKAIAGLLYAGLYLMRPVPPPDDISSAPTGPDSFRAL